MNNAFLVRVSVSLWTARKLDKTATRETKERAGAGSKAGVKVYKSILAADELDAIHKIAGMARTEHMQRTVPWAYDGPGAITAEGYPAYKATMAALEKQFVAAVGAFIAVYEHERADVMTNSSNPIRVELGKMFNPADYPSSPELRDKFSFRISAEPMPEADNFRVNGLPPEIVEDIKEDIAENQANALENANAVAWRRVVERVEMLKLRLEEYTSGKVTKFYDSWVENISELVTMIPSINVAGDPALTRIAQKLVALTAYTPADLKDNATLRAEIVKQAGLVLAQIGDAYKRAA